MVIVRYHQGILLGSNFSTSFFAMSISAGAINSGGISPHKLLYLNVFSLLFPNRAKCSPF